MLTDSLLFLFPAQRPGSTGSGILRVTGVLTFRRGRAEKSRFKLVVFASFLRIFIAGLCVTAP